MGSECTHYHLNSDNIYPQLALSISRIGTYLQISNKIMKNQEEKKQRQKQIHKQIKNVQKSCNLHVFPIICFSHHIHTMSLM